MWVNFDDSTSFNENSVALEEIDQNPVNMKGKAPFCTVNSSLLNTRGRIINFRQNHLHQFWIMFAISNGMEGDHSGKQSCEFNMNPTER